MRKAGVNPRRTALVAAGAVLVLDQASKQWALASLGDGPIRLLGNALRLRLVRNSGAAFGLLPGWGGWLALAAVLAVVGLALGSRRVQSRPEAIALGLVLGGAVGNLSDRLFRGTTIGDGRVVDFIDPAWFWTFNLADAAITTGAFIFLFAELRK